MGFPLKGGQGEYTTGITPSGQSKSDKKVSPSGKVTHDKQLNALRSVWSASRCSTCDAAAKSPSGSCASPVKADQEE